MATTPRDDLAGYLVSYPQEAAFGEEPPETVMDRYHTADVEWHTDGLRLDREKLIAHFGPVRRNAVAIRCEVHDVVVDGDRIAARYTMHATMRKGRTVTNEIYLFGQLAEDGRIRRVDQVSRSTDGA